MTDAWLNDFDRFFFTRFYNHHNNYKNIVMSLGYSKETTIKNRETHKRLILSSAVLIILFLITSLTIKNVHFC